MTSKSAEYALLRNDRADTLDNESSNRLCDTCTVILRDEKS